MAYKLSSVLYGHVLDVRGLAVTADGCIVSASRDKTAKLWKPNSGNAGFTEAQTFKGHSNYVVSIGVLPKSDVFPNGLIITGGNDKVFCGFLPKSPKPVFAETRHTNTICRINPGILPDTVLTSSWDATARLWKITLDSDHTYQSVLLTIFKGHIAAVWSAIQLSSNQVVTCSADKSINIYSILPGDPEDSSVLTKKLTGHTDCVRDLAALSDNEFLSCSNDATVKRWNSETGECLETFYGHPSYIYSMSVFCTTHPSNPLIVTGGEDRYLNFWQCSEQQVILQPAQSIWAVAILPNTDIVVGTSDGIIRIFSADSTRQATEEAQAAFQEQVDNVNQEAQKEIGGIKVDSLPGLEALTVPGKNDGQILMINENGQPTCYKWLSNESKWEKIGDVLSAAKPNKNMFEGKEYDFVWTVDIGDDIPPLQLPFNRDQDPWIIAQAFIHKHNLPQSYLETVANFIVNNAKAGSQTLSADPGYVDPFTGSARYVPPSNNTSSSQTYGQNHFTQQSGQASEGYNKFFPQTNYLKFDQANIASILVKVQEFNKTSGDSLSQLKQSQIDSLKQLCDENTNPDEQSVMTLITLLDWPKDILFPILDITRLAVRNKHVNDILCFNNLIMDKLLPHVYDIGKPINQMLAIRCLCNLMHHEKGELIVVKYYENLIKFINSITDISQKQLQVAVATLVLNLSVMIKQSDDNIAIQTVNDTISTLCTRLNEPEAMFRCFVAIGTLLSSKVPPTLSEKTRDFIALMASSSDPSKVLSCCKHLMAVIGK